MSGRDKSELKHGVNDRPYLELRNPSGARLDVYLYGAHVTSWRDAEGREMLFMSRESVFKPGFPIRGGIPVVFPQFGAGPLPPHGFARINDWTLLNSQLTENGCAEARLGMSENQQTLKLWPHKFRLELVFRLKAAELEISFSIANTGEEKFEFKNGLHPYFAVADIGQASLAGLIGAGFVDFLGDKTVRVETRKKIKFERETDRIYPSAPNTVIWEDDGNRRRMVIEKQGMNDVVIWNPWVEKSKRMEDFGDDEYKTMICVETGNLHQPVILSPGAFHNSRTKFIPQLNHAESG